MRPSTVPAAVREFFLLKKAEATVTSYTPAQHALVSDQRDAGVERLRAARAASSPVATCLLLRDAVAALARARAMSIDATLDPAGLVRPDWSLLTPALPPDPLDGRVGDADRVRDVLASRDPLY